MFPEWDVTEFNKKITDTELSKYQRADKMPSSQHKMTTLAANHDCNRKQMAVISECANIGECSYGSHPITTSPHIQDLKTDDIHVRHLNDNERDGVEFG